MGYIKFNINSPHFWNSDITAFIESFTATPAEKLLILVEIFVANLILFKFHDDLFPWYEKPLNGSNMEELREVKRLQWSNLFRAKLSR